MRVLVVDDSPDIRFMLRILLEDAGMDVEEAHSGTVALERLGGWARGTRSTRWSSTSGCLTSRAWSSPGSSMTKAFIRRCCSFTAYLHPLQQGEAAELGVTVVDKSELLELVGALRATQIVGRAA